MLYFVIIVCSCTEKKHKNLTYHQNGQLKKLIVPIQNHKNERLEYTFYENGEIESINRFNKKGLLQGEQVWFYPDGILSKKNKYVDNEIQGNGYSFYDTTGALKDFRYFRNDLQVLFGSDFWGDSMDVMKASLHFNNRGQLYYKKNFDKQGNFLSEEGKHE